MGTMSGVAFRQGERSRIGRMRGLVSVLETVVRQLKSSGKSEGRQILSQILKHAAAVNLALRGHGNYSTGETVRREI